MTCDQGETQKQDLNASLKAKIGDAEVKGGGVYVMRGRVQKGRGEKVLRSIPPISTHGGKG